MVHGLSSAGDAVVAVALAGSIFFNVSVTAAQSRVALSLALTVAPFAIVGPLLGPLVERARGGKRATVIFSAGGRAICCFFMAFWAHSLVLFPVAFFTLVFSKLYLVTKAALVPGVVERPEQLVLANSKLTVGRFRRRYGRRRPGCCAVGLVQFSVRTARRYRRVPGLRLGCDTAALGPQVTGPGACGHTRAGGPATAPTGPAPAPSGCRPEASSSPPWPRPACGR